MEGRIGAGSAYSQVPTVVVVRKRSTTAEIIFMRDTFL